jgi:hypothetical protein
MATWTPSRSAAATSADPQLLDGSFLLSSKMLLASQAEYRTRGVPLCPEHIANRRKKTLVMGPLKGDCSCSMLTYGMLHTTYAGLWVHDVAGVIDLIK